MLGRKSLPKSSAGSVLSGASGLGEGQAIGVGAGLDEVAAEGETVDDGGAKARGSVHQFRQQLFTASGGARLAPRSMFTRGDSTQARVVVACLCLKSRALPESGLAGRRRRTVPLIGPGRQRSPKKISLTSRSA